MMRRGFSLIEILLVVAILSAMAGVFTPTVLELMAKQRVRVTVDSVVSLVDDAHRRSILRYGSGTWGIRFTSQQAILFEGTSYASRVTASDIPVSYDGGVVAAPTPDVVFTSGSGRIGSPVSLSFTQGNAQASLAISTLGIPSY